MKDGHLFGMFKDVEDWIYECEWCLCRKTPTITRAPLVSVRTTQPLELVCMDFLKLDMCKDGFENVLVITDHFTRYAQAVPMKNMTAKTTAEVFYNNFIIHYGLSQRIHSDQGANFERKFLRELSAS